MEKPSIEKLEERVSQLEHLAWSLFRALETYITFNDRPIEREERDHCFVEKIKISDDEMKEDRE